MASCAGQAEAQLRGLSIEQWLVEVAEQHAMNFRYAFRSMAHAPGFFLAAYWRWRWGLERRPLSSPCRHSYPEPDPVLPSQRTGVALSEAWA